MSYLSSTNKALSIIWVWLKRYWYIPAFILVSVLTWFLFRRSGVPWKETIAEVRAIQAEATVRKLETELSTEKAKQVVRVWYEKEIASLEEKQKEQAKELENDPAELAKFLVRVSGKPFHN